MTAANWQAIGAGSETSAAWPAHASGDWGFCVVQTGTTLTTPSGWTLMPGSPVAATASAENCYIFMKLAASGSETAVDLTALSGTNHSWGRIFTVRNAHQTLPIHASASGPLTNASGTLFAFPDVITLIDDCLIVNVFGWTADSAGPTASAEANASLTGLTEQGDDGTITGNGGGIVIYSGTMASPGATGMTTATSGVAPTGFGYTIAFAPIADKTIAGTVTINGAAAANGQDVRVLDLTQPAASYLCVAGTTGSGTGAFTCTAPYTDHNYQAVYEDGASYGASAVDVAV